MEDDDDYVDIDIDQIVQAHTTRGSGQVGTEPSQATRIDRGAVPTGAPQQPPQPQPHRPSASGGFLPPYQPSPYQVNANAAAGLPMHNSYGGQPPRPPQAQPQQGGSLFQNTATRTAAGESNLPLQRLPQYNIAAPTAAASSTSSGATVPPPAGTYASAQGNPYGYHRHPPPQPTSSMTSSALGAGSALPSNKPRSLGQQMGFGAPGPAGAGAGAGAQGGPYGSYGAPFSTSNNVPLGSAAVGPAPGHVTGAYGPACGSSASAGLAGRGPVAPGKAAAQPPIGAPPVALTASALGTVTAAAGPAAAVVAAAGGNSAAAASSPNAAPAVANPNAAYTATQSGSAAAVPPPSYWHGGGAAASGAPQLATSQAPAAGFTSSQVPPGPAAPHSGYGQYPGGAAGSGWAIGGGGGGLHPGMVSGGGGGFVGSGGAALQPPGADVEALRAQNSALEAELEALKRQLQESVKLAKGAQSLQEQLQHAQMEAQELQRKHRETSLRLQEERSRGEAAERERNEVQGKCLMLEAELHKARASSGVSGAARSPPPKQGGGGPSGGGAAKRPRHGPEPYGQSSPLLRQQQPAHRHLQRVAQQQEQQPQQQGQHHGSLDLADNDPSGGEAPNGHSGNAVPQGQQRGDRGGSGAAAAPAHGSSGGAAVATTAPAAAASPPVLLLSALDGLLGAPQPLWQRLWCTCPDSLTVLLHPTAAAATAAAASAAAAAAAGADGDNDDDDDTGPGPVSLTLAAAAAAAAGLMFFHASQGCLYDGELPGDGAESFRRGSSDGDGEVGDGDGDGAGFDLRGRCAALAEDIRSQLRGLAAGRGDGTAVLQAVVALLQAATGSRVWEVPSSSAGDGDGDGGGGGGGPSARGAAAAQPAAPADAAPGTAGAAVTSAAAASPSPSALQGGDPHGTAQRRENQPPQDLQQQQQRLALWPLVGPCVELLGGLLAHSAACREAVGGAGRVAVGLASPSSSSPSVLPPAAAVAVAAAAAGSAWAGGPGGGGELCRGGLPYLLAAPSGHSSIAGGGGAAAAAAAAARAERRRQLRSFVYGDAMSEDSSRTLAFGGSLAVCAAGSGPPMGMRPCLDGADSVMRQAFGGGESGSRSQGRCDAADGAVCSLGELVRLLMAVAACCEDGDEGAETAPASGGSGGSGGGAGGVVAAATHAAPHIDVRRCVAAALSAVAAALPAASRRRALLPALADPLHLLLPLLCRTAMAPRMTATALLHLLLENPHCAAAAATALRAPGQAAVSAPTLLDPADAVQLFIALLDALEPDDPGEAGGAAGSDSRCGGDVGGDSGAGGGGSPYELPRRVLSLLAMLLDAGHEALVGALCCPPWLEGYGLPLRLLALADSACSPPGSEDPLEPVYPTPTNPALDIVSGVCVSPAEWLQRLRVAQEALVLLKELLTAGSEDTRRAALYDLASTSPDSDSQQLVELATTRLGAWARAPEELLRAAVGREAGLAPLELAPWAARLALGGGSGAASRAIAGRGIAGGVGEGGGGVVVVCGVEAVGALAGSVRRRWQHWQLQQQQAWQQYRQQQQQQEELQRQQG